MLAVLAAVLVAATSAAHAQNVTPVVSCKNFAKYDLNGDGMVSYLDMDLWVRTVHESGDRCQLGGPVGSCPSWVDVNGDGLVTVADVDTIGAYIRTCLQPRRNTLPPW